MAQATLTGQCLEFSYQSRSSSGNQGRRLAHPQRLLHYRSNWYLLAHCENAQALRLFSLDRISKACATENGCLLLGTAELDAFALSGFGIFGGQVINNAHLRFTEHAAKWVAEETWHPEQESQWLDDGYHLNVPYADDRELVMEILRYGAEVEVLEPPELRAEVARRIRKMAEVYSQY